MNKKVLIVDDEPHIRLLLEQSLEELEDEGVEIITADNGLDGLEMIKTERPAIVFLDVMMPGMNGYEVCEKVKKEEGMEDVYVVLLTAKGQEVDRQRGQAAGADLYMTKPFNPDEVLDRARKVLGMD